MSKLSVKRTVDMQIIGDWVEPRSRVLDLGCGRGVLLEYLVQTKQVFAVGVDMDFTKITSCVKRGIIAYQGDMMEYMRAFPDGHFDRVICSRTLEELQKPEAVITEALRVGKPSPSASSTMAIGRTVSMPCCAAASPSTRFTRQNGSKAAPRIPSPSMISNTFVRSERSWSIAAPS